LQDLRRRIYVKAKAEPSWRFWGLYVHVCKIETLRDAYELAKKNDGAPGSDGVTFAAIEAQGAETLLKQLRDESCAKAIESARSSGDKKPERIMPPRRIQKSLHDKRFFGFSMIPGIVIFGRPLIPSSRAERAADAHGKAFKMDCQPQVEKSRGACDDVG